MGLPTLSADLLLIHAPAFFDFRAREDIYFPFLGSSGDVPITPLYEYFPVGFKTLQRYLGDRGHAVRIINLSTVLLRYPALDADALLRALDARVVGIDLHWMVHVQGALAVAERLKRVRPDLPVLLGGISATYYAEELIRYPFVDLVMRGYDTHAPMDDLLRRLADGRSLDGVANLSWKTADGQPRHNDLAHLPDQFACGIDWRQLPEEHRTQTLPVLEFMSTQNAGCAYNCGFCGGSRDAFRRIFKRHRAMARKPLDDVRFEFETLRQVPDVDTYHFYSVGSYNESRAGMEALVDQIGRAGVRSVSYEQFHLTPDDGLRRMVAANPRTSITLSPESHDLRVAKLAGRGVYTNEQLEAWLERALELGIHGVDVWYFIGMPEQDERSVMETVDYATRLIERFGRRVSPMLCPMIPFLDPASTWFEDPEAHGFRVFHRTAEEHRRAMERASIINRINYETRWLRRSDLIDVGFRAVRALMQAKAQLGSLPRRMVDPYVASIDDALAFIPVVHEADCLEDARARAAALAGLGGEIRRRNDRVLFGGVANQAFPLNREIGGRWFDELGWPASELDAQAAAG
ncbi:MAG TPA: cobalamin-dependent protein [Kofleriaceae bacterium]|nr:cobalamin-dependent protein [Kofleriaceae bacterium]